MATVRTVIHGKEYALGCDDGQEHHLMMLAEQLAARCKHLTGHLGRVPEGLMLVYAALTFIDEALEAKKSAAHLAQASASGSDTAELDALQASLAEHLLAFSKRVDDAALALEKAA